LNCRSRPIDHSSACSTQTVQANRNLVEVELSEITEIFGNVAQRFSAYAKFGTIKGAPFAARGMIATQFIRTPAGWKMSAMAWDDERPGLALPAPEHTAESAVGIAHQLRIQKSI
jgi:hypothetical protein